ncbi:MAG: phosphoribosylformylglycinamidine synthase [Bacteroidetes bacterium]|nr:MAG: phosphoribosylformylglycinamidine synthase [Bacteroidota bacterium]
MYKTIQTYLKSNIKDAKALGIQAKAKAELGIDTGNVRTSTLYAIDYALSDKQIINFAEQCLQNPISKDVLINRYWDTNSFNSLVAVAQLPGVTDDEGTSAQMALADFLNESIDLNVQHIYTQKVYYFEKALSEAELQRIARAFLGNPLINHFQCLVKTDAGFNYTPYVPKVAMHIDETVDLIDLNLSDDALVKLSEEKVLALSLEEMKAIRDYYQKENIKAERQRLGLPEQPTDIELEVFAQTWSEHCKHKEFNAKISYENKVTGETKTINSLFKTYIKGSTDEVKAHLEANKIDWLVKVFTDNAGMVKINDDQLLAWKVETHNSPSALDPYGGAITGILGVNRDIMGTGIGGVDLLFNTNVLCFGPPNYDKPLLKGQLHPRRIMDGVVEGIEDGGNKSGIPTVNGSIIFDDRFAGKPLVFCGTGGVIPMYINGKKAWEKPIDAGDRIIMAGGRVGKDGIHGATFSSIEINENSPMSAVQIGSPITQKKLSDFMQVAVRQGLIKTSTDNGAGGLSSSIGELAETTDGAVVNLEKVPLKYAGLKPWEIFVSESQERMTIVVEPEQLEEFLALAAHYEVEATDIGYFTNSGYLDVRFKDETINYLVLDFLHNGVPQKQMLAEWVMPDFKEPYLKDIDFNRATLTLMNDLNVCSRENVIRKYDHEVKGKTIIKPLMGSEGIQPQDAGVMRVSHETFEGIAVSNGIAPKFGDIDAYEMSCGAFDEAIRQIIAVGGQLPNTKPGDDVFWTVNDNFCVPDSEYHPEKNPDGKEKLAKLVQMCEGLYDMATFYDIPMTSGKDSMKNDFKAEGVKISVPPTILYSMVSKIKDVRQTLTSNFKTKGHLVYQVGQTYDELGGSTFYKLYNELGANVPKVRKEAAKALYLKMMKAHEDGLLVSAHDLSDGGLVVALSECLLGTSFGLSADVTNVGDLSSQAKLFAESHSRFVVSISPENKTAFESLMGDSIHYLGSVDETKTLEITDHHARLVEVSVEALAEQWQNGLV